MGNKIAIRAIAAALASGAAIYAAQALAAQPVTGRWITQDRDAIVEVAPCGTSLCGRVVKFLKTPPQGAGQRDTNNPDPKLRSRPLLGLAVLTGFTAGSDDWRGRIYDPKTGRSYRSILRREGPVLVVKGCIGPFCQSQRWTAAR